MVGSTSRSSAFDDTQKGTGELARVMIANVVISVIRVIIMGLERHSIFDGTSNTNKGEIDQMVDPVLSWTLVFLHARAAKLAAPFAHLVVHIPADDCHDDKNQSRENPVSESPNKSTSDATSQHASFDQPRLKVGCDELLSTL